MQRRTLLQRLAGGATLAAAGLDAWPPARAAAAAATDTAPPARARLRCDLSAPAQPLRHPWRHCVGSCHATTALRADWQQQLARARRELGVRHVRFHGLLDDDMGTLVEQGGRFIYSFFNTDRILDFLRSIGMRPVVELSFMPTAIASGGDVVFHYRGNVTPPRRLSDWSELVSRLVGHWVERYGIDEVAQWPLEVWNEPNLRAFWTGGQAGYFELWRATWQAVKAVSPRLQVGGPATAANGWLPEFLAWTTARGCPADFVSTHYYPTDAFGATDTDTVSQLADAPPDVLRQRAREARAAAGERPLYYTEWNITSNPRDPMHDGPFCAALAARFALGVDDLVDGCSWWTFTDLFEENYFPSTPYHGGFGLLNLYGVPKPVYRGFELLGALGARAWPVPTGHPTLTVVAGAPADDGTTALLLLNVAHPRHPVGEVAVEVELAGLAGRRPRAATLARIDATHANPRAAWEAMGRPESLQPAQVAALEAASALVPEAIGVDGDGTVARVALAMPADAMALVRIEWGDG
jgi:xylan 1,4-beta-xylosidase